MLILSEQSCGAMVRGLILCCLVVASPVLAGQETIYGYDAARSQYFMDETVVRRRPLREPGRRAQPRPSPNKFFSQASVPTETDNSSGQD
jgi:hypothetical protein